MSGYETPTHDIDGNEESHANSTPAAYGMQITCQPVTTCAHFDELYCSLAPFHRLDRFIATRRQNDKSFSWLQCREEGCDSRYGFNAGCLVCLHCQQVHCTKRGHSGLHATLPDEHHLENEDEQIENELLTGYHFLAYDPQRHEFYCHYCNSYVIFLDAGICGSTGAGGAALATDAAASWLRAQSEEMIHKSVLMPRTSSLIYGPECLQHPLVRQLLVKGAPAAQQQSSRGRRGQASAAAAASASALPDGTYIDADNEDRFAMYHVLHEAMEVDESMGDSLLELRELQQTRAAEPPNANVGIRGLHNLGNTCYMNCILQALVHNPLLRNYLLCEHENALAAEALGLSSTDATKSQYRTKYALLRAQLRQIVYDMNCDVRNTPIVPHRFLFALWQAAEHLATYKQHDAHEFFVSALNALSLDSFDRVAQQPSSQQSSIRTQQQQRDIAELTFRGEFRSDVTCLTCHNVSTTVDPFLDISLQIKSKLKEKSSLDLLEEDSSDEMLSTLVQCLERYTRQEALDGRIHCSCCGSKQPCNKRLSFRKLPPVLSFHLKRFEHVGSSTRKTTEKINDFVEFPMELDMKPFIWSSINSENQQSNDDARYRYELFAVAEHKGNTMESGHYTCFVRRRGQWYLCDDRSIFYASEQDVASCNAYVLFYVLQSLQVEQETIGGELLARRNGPNKQSAVK